MLSGFVIFASLLNISTIIQQCSSGNYTIICLDAVSFFIIIATILWRKIDAIKEEYSYKERRLEEDFEKKNRDLESNYNIKNNRLERDYKALVKTQNAREEKMKDILENSYPFSYIASLSADMMLYIYDETIQMLKSKRYPALSAAKEVKKLKVETRGYILQYKEMLYKYEFLLKTFPELYNYVEDEESLLNLSQNKTYDDFKENRDRASDYLSKEEWRNLNVDERNQLALDNYKKKTKSNWVIGIEYEMYVEYILRKNGFMTIPFGSTKGLEDLGRDIIATKRNIKGEMITYIIQCKNWAAHKEIHENTICQLFGTTIEYSIKNKSVSSKIIPVLYSTTKLSDMAIEFAKRLGVFVHITEKKEFPMIKCNINNEGNKIYHLPFDQQYYKTQICKPGEFYAWTVKEAVDAGFRRAFRFNMHQN